MIQHSNPQLLRKILPVTVCCKPSGKMEKKQFINFEKIADFVLRFSNGNSAVQLTVFFVFAPLL